MPLQILGLNRDAAPVEIREQIVYSGEAIDRALEALCALDGVTEGVILSTCNRTEFYIDCNGDGLDVVSEWLVAEQRLSSEVASALFTLSGDDAIRHLFRVACGLDSMVLGEPQILGQLKEAYRKAETSGSARHNLGQLFRHTFSVAKKVRTDTEIGGSPVSVAYAAVDPGLTGFSRASRSIRRC
ncbi:MAG: hypothetical protein U5K38_14560 [Woeseiaceae bacterium]|nr:hypothetical protein [Woeseiaceae bacterium]